MFAGLAVVNAAYAGWGAIAYNPTTGAASGSQEYSALPDALNAAIKACGMGCLIVTWEHDECVAFATNPNGVWGSFANAANKDAAVKGAVAACGQSDCTAKQVACD